MRLAGEALFLLLVLANVATLFRLGSPLSYRDRGVAAWLWLTAWSALLFDVSFLVAILQFARGSWVEWAMLLSLALRLGLSVWLLWNLPGRDDVDQSDPQN